METACVQPVTIATVIMTVVTLPIHVIGLINLFVKMSSSIQNQSTETRQARRTRSGKATIRPEESEAFV